MMPVFRRTTSKLLSGAAIIALFFGAIGAQAAATVTDVFDQPSSIDTGDDSNHEFNITLSSGIAEGEALTIEFPSDFDTSAIVEDDVDIADDGVDLTTAATCADTEEASVAMAADTLTITICAGDGGAIAIGSVVVVEIGLNASSSGTGANQITNPTGEGTYFVNLFSTSGNSGSVLLPIADPGTAGVTGVVEGGGGDGGGGGGGGDPDPEPCTTDCPPEPCTTDCPPEPCTTDCPPEPCTTDCPPEPCTTDCPPEPCTTDCPPEPCTTDCPPEPCTTDCPPGPEPGPGPVTPPDGGGGADVHEVSLQLFVAEETIELLPDDTTYRAIERTAVTARVFVDDASEVETVTVQYGSILVPATLVGPGIYEAEFNAGSLDADLVVTVDFTDGQTTTFSRLIDVQDQGIVYELVSGQIVPIDGAVVIVYEGTTTRMQWPADNYAQQNPFITGINGEISWYVPNGVYLVTAGRSLFEDGQISSVVTDNILAPSIRLERSTVIPPIEEPTEPTPEPEPSLPEPIAGILETISDILDDIRSNPEVQASAEISNILAVTALIGSALILASAFSLLPFLQYLFTAPILFFARRRREQFGVVYNAYTKVPIDLAIVRLFSDKGNLLQTRVTDKEGRYFFKADPGRYFIQVVKKDFTSPSAYLSGIKDDGKFLDVYTGQIIEVTEKNAVIAANIPIDPVIVPEGVTRKIAFRRFLRVLQHSIAILGVALSLYVFVIQPSWLTGGLLILQVVIYLITRRLARPQKRKGWGIVYERKTKKPVANTVVRLFEPKYNKLLESTITDNQGRYAFMVGPNEYFVTFEKPGYEKQEVRPIDYRNKEKPELVSVNVALQKK